MQLPIVKATKTRLNFPNSIKQELLKTHRQSGIDHESLNQALRPYADPMFMFLDGKKLIREKFTTRPRLRVSSVTLSSLSASMKSCYTLICKLNLIQILLKISAIG